MSAESTFVDRRCSGFKACCLVICFVTSTNSNAVLDNSQISQEDTREATFGISSSRIDHASPNCPKQLGPNFTLTLGAAIDISLCNNPQLSIAWAIIKGQQAAVVEARAAYWPSATASLSRLNDRTSVYEQASSTVGGEQTGISVTWRMFDFGGRAAELDESERLLEAALASRDAAIQALLLEVVGEYSDVVTTRASLEVRNQAETSAESTLQSAVRREGHGVMANIDVLEAQSALSRAKLEVVRAVAAVEKARAVLFYSLGVAASSEPQIPEDYTPRLSEDHRKLHEWLEMAKRTHPAIASALLKWTASEEHVTVVRSEGLPTVDVSADFFGNGRPEQGLTPSRTGERVLGITLSIPIFDGFKNSSEVWSAKAAVEQREAELHETENAVMRDVVKAYSDAQAAESNLSACEEYVHSSDELLVAARRRYDRGVADISEIINAQNASVAARSEHIRCVGDWRLARLKLRASVGVLGRELVEP